METLAKYEISIDGINNDKQTVLHDVGDNKVRKTFQTAYLVQELNPVNNLLDTIGHLVDVISYIQKWLELRDAYNDCVEGVRVISHIGTNVTFISLLLSDDRTSEPVIYHWSLIIS